MNLCGLALVTDRPFGALNSAFLLALGLFLSLSPAVSAGTPAVGPAPAPPEITYDPVWDWAALVNNPQAPVVQYFGLNARYAGTYDWLDSNEGDNEGWENRRERLGLEGTFFRDLEFFSSFNLNTQAGDFFRSVDEIYLKWKPSAALNLSVGCIKPAITPEYRTADRYMITAERSQLVLQVAPTELWGAGISGKVKSFLYDLGVYSAAGDVEHYGLPVDRGGVAVFVSGGYDFGEKGTVRADYLYQDGNAENNFVKPFHNVFSVSYEGTYLDSKLGLTTNVIYGEGQGQGLGDVWGLIVMPSYFVTPKVQVVARYGWSGGDGDDALLLPLRYDRTAPDLVSPRVNDYQSIYAGVNYYLSGQHLKFMTGIEYATATRNPADYESWTITTSVRLSIGQGKRR